MEEITKSGAEQGYGFDDIIQAALSDETWELPEDLRWPLYGADVMLVIV